MVAVLMGADGGPKKGDLERSIERLPNGSALLTADPGGGHKTSVPDQPSPESQTVRRVLALERATATARRKEIFEALHPETKQGKAGGKADHPTQRSTTAKSATVDALSFVSDTASKTGKSERSVRLDAQIGAKLTAEEITKLKGTPAEDNQRELLSIARRP